MTYDDVWNGCQCHNGYPPCWFCTNLSEIEFNIYDEGGRDALLRFVTLDPEEQAAEAILRGIITIPSTELTDEQKEIFGL